MAKAEIAALEQRLRKVRQRKPVTAVRSGEVKVDPIDLLPDLEERLEAIIGAAKPIIVPDRVVQVAKQREMPKPSAPPLPTPPPRTQVSKLRPRHFHLAPPLPPPPPPVRVGVPAGAVLEELVAKVKAKALNPSVVWRVKAQERIPPPPMEASWPAQEFKGRMRFLLPGWEDVDAVAQTEPKHDKEVLRANADYLDMVHAVTAVCTPLLMRHEAYEEVMAAALAVANRKLAQYNQDTKDSDPWQIRFGSKAPQHLAHVGLQAAKESAAQMLRDFKFDVDDGRVAHGKIGHDPRGCADHFAMAQLQRTQGFAPLSCCERFWARLGVGSKQTPTRALPGDSFLRKQFSSDWGSLMVEPLADFHQDTRLRH